MAAPSESCTAFVTYSVPLQKDAASWAQRAVLDEAGAPLVQARIREAVAKGEPIDLKKFMWERSAPASQ